MRNVIIRSLVHSVFISVFGIAFIWIAWPPEPACAAITVIEFSITTNAADRWYPAISGSTVVWHDARNGNWDIYGYDLTTHTEFPIAPNAADQSYPAISGSTVVWHDARNGNWDIYGYDLTTHTEFPISTNAADQLCPAISGNTVVWRDNRNGNYDIYGYDLTAHTEFPIATNAGDQRDVAISGSVVVWDDFRNGKYDIYGYDLTTHTEFRILTNDAAILAYPVISGNTVVWQDARNGNWDIYGYDLTTHTEFPIATNAAQQWYPAISGSTVVWDDYNNGNYDICGYDLTTHTEFPIATNVAHQWYPAIDISGSTVVWMDDRNGNSDIYGATIDYGMPPPPGLSVVSDMVIETANSSASGLFSDVYGSPMHTYDPLRSVSPCPLIGRADFGNSVQRRGGWVTIIGPEDADVVGDKEEGQWSRLGMVIDPSVGFLIKEVDWGTRDWRSRTLTVASTGSFKYSSSDPGKQYETVDVSLDFDWQANGCAKEDWVAEIVNFVPTAATVLQHSLLTGIDYAHMAMAERESLRYFWNQIDDHFELYNVGIEWVPSESRYRGWVNALLTLEDSEGNVLGATQPMLRGWPGHDGLTGLMLPFFMSEHDEVSVSIPVGETVKARLALITNSEAKGAAEAYFGITNYTITINGPEGSPIVFDSQDSGGGGGAGAVGALDGGRMLRGGAGSMDITGSLTESLVLGAATGLFCVGNIQTLESFGDVEPLAGTRLVTLTMDEDNYISGVMLPLEVISGMDQVDAHVQLFWLDGAPTSDIYVEFMLLDENGDAFITGGSLEDLYAGQPALLEGYDWQSGEQIMTLDLSEVPQGTYALAIVFANSGTAPTQACMVIQGLSGSITTVPEPGTVALIVPAVLGFAGVAAARRRK